MNNATLFAADRATHVKIVVVALVASIAVCLIGLRAHVKPGGSGALHPNTTGLVMAGS